MVEHLDADLGQAFQIFGIERNGPGGILAHHHRGLHVQAFGADDLEAVADAVGDEGGGEIAVEGVFEVVVIVMHALGDDVARSTWRDHRQLQPAGPRFQGQDNLADIAGDDGVHLVLAGGTLEGAHGVGGGVVVVILDDLDHAAIDATGGVDLLGGKSGRLRDGGTADGANLGDDTDLDRVGGLRRTDRQGERCRQCHAQRLLV